MKDNTINCSENPLSKKEVICFGIDGNKGKFTPFLQKKNKKGDVVGRLDFGIKDMLPNTKKDIIKELGSFPSEIEGDLKLVGEKELCEVYNAYFEIPKEECKKFFFKK